MVSQIATQRRAGRGRRAAQLARSAARPPARRAAGTALRGAGAGRRPTSSRHSVWLHNSLRGAVGPGPGGARRQPDRCAARVLGRARHALGAALERAEHRPERRARPARHRGRLRRRRRGASRSIGTNTTLLWFLLPPAVLLAGVAPAAISFAAGQAAFTLTLADPLQHPRARRLAGRARADRGRRDRRRREPGRRACCSGRAARRRARQGAGRGVRRQRELPRRRGAIRPGALRPRRTPRCPRRPTRPPRGGGRVRRLDDAFRSYLAERGAKPLPLAEVTSLVTGVGRPAPGRRRGARPVAARRRQAGGDRAAARRELLATTDAMTGWYATSPPPSPARAAYPSRSPTTSSPTPARRRRPPRPARRRRPGHRHRRADDLDRRPPRRRPPAAGHARRTRPNRRSAARPHTSCDQRLTLHRHGRWTPTCPIGRGYCVIAHWL